MASNTYSSGLLNVNTLNITAGSSGAIDTVTMNANDLTVGNNLITPLLTVNNIQGTTDLNNQLTSIQYAVGVDPDATISDQDALKEMNFLTKLFADFEYALQLYKDNPTDSTEVAIFTGEFPYINPTDGSGYIGQMWKGDNNPLVQYYMGPSGEETRAISSLDLDTLTYSILSISFLAKFAIDPVYINTCTPFHAKLMEEYDQPSLYINFRVSMYNKTIYCLKNMRNELNTSVEAEAELDGLLTATLVPFENDISLINNLYQFSGFPSNDEYSGSVSMFEAFQLYCGYNNPEIDIFFLPFPQIDNNYAFGISAEPGPVWQGAVANNLVKYFKSWGRQLNYIAEAFKSQQPIFHKYANGATGSTTLGYTDDSNTFQYFNPLTEQIETQIKYKVPADGTTKLVQNIFSVLNGVDPTSDTPFTGMNEINAYPITGIFSLPPKWWQMKRNDYFVYLNDFDLMYQKLLTLEGGQAVIDACQTVWEEQIIPASQNCYAQFKYCKTRNLIDDQYPGSWRFPIKKDIDYVDVVNIPYTVYLHDGTSLALNSPEIYEQIYTQNNIVTKMICKQPTSTVPAFTKIDSSRNYTNYTGYQNISDNYSIVDLQISQVTPEILSGADTDSKTAASCIFESGVELSKYFNDLESYAIYNGLGNGSIQIPLYPGGPNLTQEQFNTDVSGTVWNIQKVYEEFLNTIGKTKSDWDVIGYYYGRHPVDPLYNVYNPVIFDGPVDASGYATDSSGNNVYQRRALQGGNNQFVLEGGHTGSDASGWDNPNNIFQLVYDGSGATPYRSTRTRIDNVRAPLTNYVVRSNYDASNVPVCLLFDYCLVEHYQIDEVTAYPIITDGLYGIQTSSKWINGTRGNTATNTSYINRDRYRFRSFANQIDITTFLCWYNFAINQGKAATYKDASGNDTSGNGIYSAQFIEYIKYHYVMMIGEGRTINASNTAEYAPSKAAGYSWYAETFGCLGEGYTGPASISGRSSFTFSRIGTLDPQNNVKPQFNMTNSTHEVFGHGIQGAYNRANFTPDPVPWAISPLSGILLPLRTRDDWLLDDVQGSIFYVYNYNAGVYFEGYATLMEIVCTKYGLYRTPNLATIGMSDTVDSFVVLYALLNLSRIVARILCVPGNIDPTAGAGKGDVSSYPWTCQTFPVVQKILNMDSTERQVFLNKQMVTYAFGLIGNLETVNRILELHFPTDPENFKQYNYNYWKITEGSVLTGDANAASALSKPRSFWVDEIPIPNNP
jgi:hypothetical protein